MMVFPIRRLIQSVAVLLGHVDDCGCGRLRHRGSGYGNTGYIFPVVDSKPYMFNNYEFREIVYRF